MIKAEKNKEQSLYDYIIDDVDTGAVKAYHNLDIMLKEYLHPKSPRVISMLLKHMAPNGDLKLHLEDIPVPLYLCLTENQMSDIINQLGLPEGLDDLSLVVMNKARTYSNSQGGCLSKCGSTQPPCSGADNRNCGTVRKAHEADKYLEQFINHIAGLLSRFRPKVDSTWDTESHFFQPIEFKVRVGPRNSVVVDAIRNVQRGNPETSAQYDSDIDKYKYQDLTSKLPTSDRDKRLDDIGEDGTTHAAMMEHPMRLTRCVLKHRLSLITSHPIPLVTSSHTVMSPRMRAAIEGR